MSLILRGSVVLVDCLWEMASRQGDKCTGAEKRGHRARTGLRIICGRGWLSRQAMGGRVQGQSVGREGLESFST